MNSLGGSAMIAASGWVAKSIIDTAHSHGGVSALGMVGLFIFVAAVGVSICKTVAKDMAD